MPRPVNCCAPPPRWPSASSCVGRSFPFVLAGGMFRVVPSLREMVLKGVAEVAPRCEPVLLTAEPAIGAVRLALAEARGGARLPEYI